MGATEIGGTEYTALNAMKDTLEKHNTETESSLYRNSSFFFFPHESSVTLNAVLVGNKLTQ